MRCDRRRLGDDVQVVAAEHLVPSARDRLVCRRDHAEQHIAQWLPPVDEDATGQEEGTGPVMQKRRVGGPQCGRDGGVALVTR